MTKYLTLAVASLFFGVGFLTTGVFAAKITTVSTSGLTVGKHKTKAFHGYRIEAKNTVHYNTEYQVRQHATLSKYRPTQKSKVIYKYGTKIVPTRHPWIWHHGKNDNLMTLFKYSKGKWHSVTD